MSSDLLIGVRRVSQTGGRDLAGESGITLIDQEGKLHASAALVGKRIGRLVDAVDQSGFTMAGSSTMNEVLEAIERGEYAGVCFGYFERSGRNWWDQGPFFARLERAEGLFVVNGMEAIDYRTPEGRQWFGMQAITSEGTYWTAKKNSDATLEKMMTRKAYNAVAYGYQRNGTYIDGELAAKLDPGRDGKALVKQPERIRVAERIFRLRLDRYGIAAIRNLLNGEGIPGPRGNRWTDTTLRALIANPIYKGVLVQGRKHPKRRPGVKPVIRTTEDPALAIVTARQWQDAQSKRGKLQRTGTHRAGVAGGVVVCSGCGQPLQVISTGDGRFNYGCQRRQVAVNPCLRPTNVKKDAADIYVDDLVAEALEGTHVADTVRSNRRLAEIGDALAEIDTDLEALPDRVRVSDPMFAVYFERFNDRKAELEAERDTVVAETEMLTELPADAADYRRRPLEQRNRYARLLLRVEVAPPATRSRFADIRDRFTPVWR